MKKIIRTVMFLLFIFFIRPSIGQNTIPSDEVIDKLINNCFNNFYEKDKEYHLDTKYKIVYSQIVRDKKGDLNRKLSNADKVNGITYWRIIKVNFIRKLNMQKDWNDGDIFFNLIIKNGNLSIFPDMSDKKDCGHKNISSNSDSDMKPTPYQQELKDEQKEIGRGMEELKKIKELK